MEKTNKMMEKCRKRCDDATRSSSCCLEELKAAFQSKLFSTAEATARVVVGFLKSETQTQGATNPEYLNEKSHPLVAK